MIPDGYYAVARLGAPHRLFWVATGNPRATGSNAKDITAIAYLSGSSWKWFARIDQQNNELQILQKRKEEWPTHHLEHLKHQFRVISSNPANASMLYKLIHDKEKHEKQAGKASSTRTRQHR